MMRLLGRFIELAEAALAAGVEPERITGIGCMRQLQRMGEEIADDQLPRLAELEARLERDFAQLVPAAQATPTTEAPDASRLKAPRRGSKARCCSCGARSTSASTTRSRCWAATALRGWAASPRSTNSS
jgi:hypothetical protein